MLDAHWLIPSNTVSNYSYDNSLTRKFNYTILVMRYYIYTSKLNNKAIFLPEFVDEVQ